MREHESGVNSRMATQHHSYFSAPDWKFVTYFGVLFKFTGWEIAMMETGKPGMSDDEVCYNNMQMPQIVLLNIMLSCHFHACFSGFV